MADDQLETLRRAIFEARIATTDVSAFASHNIGCDEGLAAAKRLAEASATIVQIAQGAVNASP